METRDKQRLLDKVAKDISKCKICQKDKIGKPVPGEGNPSAEIMLLGEAPGKTEAQTGRPFVGRAGQLLRTILKNLGINPEDLYITSPVKYLPLYITPTPADIVHGKIHLQKQIKIIDPKIIVLMGNTAVQAILGRTSAIAKEHGKIIKEGKKTYLISYHPAAPLYSPKIKLDLIKDFDKLKELVKSNERKKK